MATSFLFVVMIVLTTFYPLNQGRSWQDKVADVRKEMAEKEVDALVVTGLDETACGFLRFIHIQKYH